MKNDEEESASRRSFLQTGATVLLGSGLLSGCAETFVSEHASEEQLAFKRKQRSNVYLAWAEDYDSVLPAMTEAVKQLSPQIKGKSIFLKINLVDYRPDIPVFTNPAVVDAAIRVLQDAGASTIRVGDGPALARDTEEFARLSGMLDVCKKHALEFVDLNIDDLQKVENPLKFTGISEFLLPKSVMSSDMVISMPKLKTHHWALMTCSMKNMFGVIPGRKYGWPKNILHVRGIHRSIVDIVAAVKPGFAIVDGIIGMEGNGPLNGSAKPLHALILGDDLTAVDTVCALCMDLPVHKISYLNLAGMVLGNNDMAQIELKGKSIDAVKQKFKLPPNYSADGTPIDPAKLKNGAESGVT